ncbi:MAG: hypothetical protein ACJAUH_002504, partial [Saprospiraceae bacterium]
TTITANTMSNNLLLIINLNVLLLFLNSTVENTTLQTDGFLSENWTAIFFKLT